MRKLLLIAMLALSTLAWAKGKDHLQSQKGGADWYNQSLTVQVDQFVRLNQTIPLSGTAIAEREPFGGQQPGAMAAPQQGSVSRDTIARGVANDSEINRRGLQALRNAPELSKKSQKRTH
jgi:hypothetical protein